MSIQHWYHWVTDSSFWPKYMYVGQLRSELKKKKERKGKNLNHAVCCPKLFLFSSHYHLFYNLDYFLKNTHIHLFWHIHVSFLLKNIKKESHTPIRHRQTFLANRKIHQFLGKFVLSPKLKPHFFFERSWIERRNRDIQMLQTFFKKLFLNWWSFNFSFERKQLLLGKNKNMPFLDGKGWTKGCLY